VASSELATLVAEGTTLYLSSDRQSLLDEKDKVVGVAQQSSDGTTVFVDPGMHTEGSVCLEWGEQQVCVAWNAQRYCITWGSERICLRWS
jgi:hypothetical protein